MAHFTYEDKLDLSGLKQGDLLSKSDDLIRILDEVHPYFCNPEYKYFLVLTQSCDLVKRNGDDCSAKHITLAAVRSLEDALKRGAEMYFQSSLEKKTKLILEERKHNKIVEFVVRLMNNNIPEYFYLHPETQYKFPEPCVAFLRVSIALRASEHYDTCLSAKVLELNDAFKAKLGWLVGNLYSRVGTEDWTNKISLEEFNKQCIDLVEANFMFVNSPKDLEKKLLQKFPDSYETLTNAEIIEFSKTYKPPTKKEKLLSILNDILTETNSVKEDYTVKRLLKNIENNPGFSSLLK